MLPPGAGKSLAANRLPSILPPLSRSEALEVTRIASACGRLGSASPVGRPFRAPHHTISPAGLLGGGQPPRPGEATLAHRGVLYLDQLGEFRRDTLEALLSSLESGEVFVGRAGTLPARAQLIAAANPCPCGRGPSGPSTASVRRAPSSVGRNRLERSLAEHVDIRLEFSQPSAGEIGGEPGETSAAVRERVCAARARQEERLGTGRANAQMSAAEARECALDTSAAGQLAELYSRQRLSGHAYDQTLRLAQTIADLAGTEMIGADQMAQALQLRRRDRG